MVKFGQKRPHKNSHVPQKKSFFFFNSEKCPSVRHVVLPRFSKKFWPYTTRRMTRAGVAGDWPLNGSYNSVLARALDPADSRCSVSFFRRYQRAFDLPSISNGFKALIQLKNAQKSSINITQIRPKKVSKNNYIRPFSSKKIIQKTHIKHV